MRFFRKLLLLCVVAAAMPVIAEDAHPRIFVGHIRTMDASDRVVDAVGVDERGLIVAVGTVDKVLAAMKSHPAVERIEFRDGETLLPGFFDAHAHVIALLMDNSGVFPLVGPCRPKPYQPWPSNCQNYIKKTFKDLQPDLGKYGNFPVGLNLDPSRQWYDENTGSEEFKKRPAYFIERDLSEDTPILLVDQSGHFGYVNHAAFKALYKHICGDAVPCAKWPPQLEPGDEWVTDCTPQGQNMDCYSGLLVEPTAYYPFLDAVSAAEQEFLKDDKKTALLAGNAAKGTLEALRKAGVTTIVSMAMDAKEVIATRKLAELPGSGTRMVSIVPPDTADGAPMNGKPIFPACYPSDSQCPRLPRDLGVTAIKMIADGSTQGCTAALQPPVSYQKGSECQNPAGHANYSLEQLYEALKKPWDTGAWRFEMHSNGNRATQTVLDVYALLQSRKVNPHTATVIHATVGEEAMWSRAKQLREGTYVIDGKPVPKIDLRFTHLIGHVAYWGAALERQLGAGSAANIDPTGWDRKYGIPFTLHSDATVTGPMPLWFMRQAITRETWVYPELVKMHVLGPEHKISVLEALRAVTIRAAEEKELDRWLGSIEVGKVGDFVLLSADPMSYVEDPDKISSITVVNTYLGGVKTGADMK